MSGKQDLDEAMLNAILAAIKERNPELSPTSVGQLAVLIAYEMVEVAGRISEFIKVFDRAEKILERATS